MCVCSAFDVRNAVGCVCAVCVWGSDSEVVARLMESLVEGYSRAKKVSAEGIAVRQLDLKVLQSELEKLTPLRPLPHINLVDEYIKAYYLSEEMAIPWIKQHQQAFNKKQILTVISQGVAARMASKQQKQQLLLIVEELDKQTASLKK